jgi:hypothetical protein
MKSGALGTEHGEKISVMDFMSTSKITGNKEIHLTTLVETFLRPLPS